MLFYVLATITIIIGLIAEGAIALFFTWRILPDFTLILVVAMGFLLGERQGAAMGLLAGLLEDIMFGHALGFFALTKMLLGLGAALVGKEIYQEKIIGPILLVFVGTIVHEIIIHMLVYLYVGIDIPLELIITSQFIPAAILNAILTVPFYALVHWMFEKRSRFSWKISA